eukprot:TRINITY_DN9427_c0_g2_i1.p1 TRINITY_DN9427_c0_g2~~TRINITY_DN9427_c0_g2_i1.p1  ORF type:complete len:268 (+),score=34.57 TRINITY_DN9427_c0_g2_i1:329-1132(+)
MSTGFYLLIIGVIHVLIESAVKQNSLKREAIQILHNVSTIKCKEKAGNNSILSQKILRLKIIQWGGFVALSYLNTHKPEQTISLNIKQLIKGKKLKATIDSVKLHLVRNTSLTSGKLLTLDDKLKIENIKTTSLKLRVKHMVLFKQEVIFPKYLTYYYRILDEVVDWTVMLQQLEGELEREMASVRKNMINADFLFKRRTERGKKLIVHNGTQNIITIKSEEQPYKNAEQSIKPRAAEITIQPSSDNAKILESLKYKPSFRQRRVTL